MMAQNNKTKRAIAITGLLVGLALAGTAAFAQTDTPAGPESHMGTMPDHGMAKDRNGMMPGMMMDAQMQEKMSRMMDNCNRMMESMMQKEDRVPNKKG